MPDIRVRDQKTGKVSTVKWNKGRAPTSDEINDLLDQQEGKPLKTGFNVADEWDDPPVSQSSASVYVGMRDVPAPPPSTFSRVLDTAYGGESSYLPPIRGVTRPALPELPREAWGPEQMRSTPQMIPGTMIPQIPAVTQWGYENLVRPSSSLVGAATDWATGKVTGPIFKGAGRWLRGGKEAIDIGAAAEARAGHFGRSAAIEDAAEERARGMFERTSAANVPPQRPPSYSPVQKALPPPSAPPRRNFIVNEEGVAVDSTRPFTPIELRPHDNRAIRTASGTVDPATGRLKPVREGGRFVERPFDSPPVLDPKDLPVIDLPPETAARFVTTPGVPPKTGPTLFKTKAAYAAEKAAREAAERELLERQAIHASPRQSPIGSGPVRVETTGRPLARRVGETLEEFRARSAAGGELPVSVPEGMATPDIPSVQSPDIFERGPFFSKQVGSGRSVEAAKASDSIFDRFRNTLADETGSVPRRKRTDLRTAASRRRTMRELEELDRAGKVTPEDVKTASKLKFPESWKQFLPESLRNERGSVDFSAIVNKMTDRQKAKAAKEVGPDWVERLESWWNKPPDVSAPGSSAKPLKTGFGQSLGTKEKPITLAKPSFKTPEGRARIKEETYSALGAPRALMSTLDLSGFRQAAGALHKKELWQNVNNMRKAVGSEKFFQELQGSIASHPKYSRASKAQLAITDLPKAGGKIAETEELFMSKMAERIPGYGKLVRASGRGYVGLLNKTRMDLFNNLTEQAAKSGSKTTDAEIAKLVNAMTGRGNLPKILEDSAPALNAMFFSPRLMASRAHLLNPVNYWKVRKDPLLRKEMAKSIATVGAKWWGMAEMLEIGSGGKFKVEKDPRSSDFGKVKIGNTRLDFGSGFQQYIRLTAQLAPLLVGKRGKYKDTDTGEIKEYGKGYRSKTEFDNAVNFFVGKLAPIPSGVATHMRGMTPTGEKPQWLPKDVSMEEFLEKSELTKKVLPMFAQDLYSISQEDPKLAASMALPLFFGESANVQKPYRRKRKYQ